MKHFKIMFLLFAFNCAFADSYFYAVPLTDLNIGLYLNQFQGGLYEDGTNTVPVDHDQVGKNIAATVVPIGGKIVVLSVGMSNAQDEFGRFKINYGKNLGINPAVDLINGANGTEGGPCDYTVPIGPPQAICGGTAGNPYDWMLANRLTPAGVTESQVQVIWFKHAQPFSPTILPHPPTLPDAKSNAYVYEGEVGGIMRALKVRYPNIKLVIMSSRIYGGYSGNSKIPEPYSYEEGFSIKWAIQAQINQADRENPADPITGDLSYEAAPWMAWGPYIWAAGSVARSDGLVWCAGSLTPAVPCNSEQDFQSDLLHPNALGTSKVATQLWNYFTTSPYTAGWFNSNAGFKVIFRK